MKKTVIAVLLLSGYASLSPAQDVTVIYTNDLHAHVEPYKLPYVAEGKRAVGGFANIATYVKQEKQKNKATFISMLEITLPVHTLAA
jgi:2',3'-cyclic-nucleotide 2'-phosphodiesterase (5'-nucleotidase family)